MCILGTSGIFFGCVCLLSLSPNHIPSSEGVFSMIGWRDFQGRGRGEHVDSQDTLCHFDRESWRSNRPTPGRTARPVFVLTNLVKGKTCLQCSKFPQHVKLRPFLHKLSGVCGADPSSPRLISAQPGSQTPVHQFVAQASSLTNIASEETTLT